MCVGFRVDVLLEFVILVRKSEASRKRGFFFTLEEIAVVIALVGVYMVAFVQCHLGAWTSKPTEMMDHATDLSMLPTKCTHAPVVETVVVRRVALGAASPAVWL